ncbi:uncharacterized protein [Gossypium hirsutum]|uniref:Uncharacterized protein n=1 Tax=Gossypium hirsutum TaxID=3635 RepID=A0ABM2YVG3_GOSHI|nr:uncharacterized protein LOC121208017 [Gossypium hirsutum]
MVETDYKRCVRFEDGLRDSLRVMIAPQRERVLLELVEKKKITEEVKHAERLNQEKKGRPRARARVNGPVRAGYPVVNPGVPPYADCGKGHVGECWKMTGTCLACGSMEHRIKSCPRRPGQVPVVGRGGVQLRPRGRGQARGSNGNRRGRGAPGRDAGHAEARQPTLFYATHHQDDGDAPDVITGMFFIHELP